MTTNIEDRQELNRLRMAAGLTWAELGRKAGIGYQRLWRFFSNSGSLSDEEKERILEVINETASPLVSRDGLGVAVAAGERKAS